MLSAMAARRDDRAIVQDAGQKAWLFTLRLNFMLESVLESVMGCMCSFMREIV
jgi:hypothetical protein